MENGVWVNKTDMLACEYGCSANQLTAKEYVARCAIAEINGEITNG
jgi:hypothetical protein